MDRAAAILTGVDTHLDHLGVLSTLLQIPLIVTEEKLFSLAREFYPGIDVRWRDLSTLSMEYLASEFDVIFETGKFWAADLASSLELLYGKKMRFVFCPHGNSDKGHSLNELVSQDISLVYGEHLLDLLKHNGSFAKIKHIVATGNYRLPYYLRHKAFYDQLAQQKVFSRFRSDKPIILYAPTWNNKENPTSFFTAAEALITELADDFNLVIKLHPFLEEDHPAHVLALTLRYEEHPSVLFLKEFPAIYPLLERSALYIGDYSSIGYDFLAFDKPLFFLSPSYTSPLFGCGKAVRPEELKSAISSHFAKTSDPYSAERKKIYSYAFGKEKNPTSIRDAIIHALKHPG